ncbi:hypothetical protein ACFX2C_006356 [Malus domestica]
MEALKCSLSLSLAVIFGLIYSKENDNWAGLSVATSLASAREATFNAANAKAQGTVLGTVYGVLGCFLFQAFLSIRLLSLIPWLIGEAEAEPNFWFLPFHSACYGKLLRSLSKMMDLLVLSAHVVEAVEDNSQTFYHKMPQY